MPKFRLEDYEPVEDRLRRFYMDHPDDARVTTDLVKVSRQDGVMVQFVVRAHLWLGGVLIATGYAEESVSDDYRRVNHTSALENCETSAIGRALANANYAPKRRPSREEMAKVQRAEDARSSQVEPSPPLEVVLELVAGATTEDELRALWTENQRHPHAGEVSNAITGRLAALREGGAGDGV